MAHVSGDELRLIFNAIDSGKCLAFLGAGACTKYEYNNQTFPGLRNQILEKQGILRQKEQGRTFFMNSGMI